MKINLQSRRSSVLFTPNQSNPETHKNEPASRSSVLFTPNQSNPETLKKEPARRSSVLFTPNQSNPETPPKKPLRRSTICVTSHSFFTDDKPNINNDKASLLLIKADTFEDILKIIKEIKKSKRHSIGGIKGQVTPAKPAKNQIIEILEKLISTPNDNFKTYISSLEKAQEALLKIDNSGKQATLAKKCLSDLIDQKSAIELNEQSIITRKNIIKEIEIKTTKKGNILRGNTDAVLDFSYVLKKQGQGFIISITKQTEKYNTEKNKDASIDQFSSLDKCKDSLNIVIKSIENCDLRKFSKLFKSLDELNTQMKTTSIGKSRDIMQKTERQKVLKSFIFLRLLTPSIVTNNNKKPNKNSKLMSKLILQAANSTNENSGDNLWKKFKGSKEYIQLEKKEINMYELKNYLNKISTKIDSWIDSFFS